MKRLVLAAATAAALLTAFAIPAAAYDPLCDKVRNPVHRERCKCNSDAGGLVFVRPGDQGRMQIYWGRPHRQASEVHNCMMKKGIVPG